MSKTAQTQKQLEWKERIQQQQADGLSIEKWCRQHQISPHTFHYWKDKLFPKPLSRSSFAELHTKQNSSISLQASGLYVRLGADCAPALRKQIFALFAELPC